MLTMLVPSTAVGEMAVALRAGDVGARTVGRGTDKACWRKDR